LVKRLKSYELLGFRRLAVQKYQKSHKVAAMLCACFDLLSPDIVEELSWQHGLNNFYMPYRIQVQQTFTQNVAALEKQVKDLWARVLQKEVHEAEGPKMIIMNGWNLSYSWRNDVS